MNSKNVKFVGGGVLDDPNFVGKTQKGITLIALVITIIVLLILAGVTISMVLGDEGIIAQAQAAKKQNDDSSLKDAISVAKGEAAIAKYDKQTPVEEEDLGDIKTRITTYNANNGDEEDYEYKNTVAKIVDGVPIPMGFSYVEGTKKDTGLIVVDGYGNEFVWVPVDEVKESGSVNYTDDKIWLVNDNSDKSDTPQNSDGIPTGVAVDYEAMKKSVGIYGGFYVGRYETSWTGTKVASIANVEAINGNTPIDFIMDKNYDGVIDSYGANWYTFYTKQKELHANSTSVVSGMIYGSQWNAIMDWMSDVPNILDSTKFYINDATGMGLFGAVDPALTGSNSDYAVKNVYDLAGNYSEFTMRYYSTSSRNQRGGSVRSNQTGQNGSQLQSSVSPKSISSLNSSRLQLYIK